MNANAQIINSNFASDKHTKNRINITANIITGIVEQKRTEAVEARTTAENAKKEASQKGDSAVEKRMKISNVIQNIDTISRSIQNKQKIYDEFVEKAARDSATATILVTKSKKKKANATRYATLKKAVNVAKQDASEIKQELNMERESLRDATCDKKITELMLDLAVADSTIAVKTAIALDTAAKEKEKVADAASSATTDSASVAEDWTGYILASGNVTNLEDNFTNPNANISIGGALVHKNSTFLFSFNPKSATTLDSMNLEKTFLFPEISSRAFVLEYDLALNGLNFHLSKRKFDNVKKMTDKTPVIYSTFFTNFSVGYLKDTSNNLITPYNFMTGFRFSIHKDLSDNKDANVQKLDHLTFSLIPYYSMTSIDPKESNSYSTMFKENPGRNMPPTIDALGSKFDFEVGSFHIFIDYKYILNSHYNSVLNNSYWTIGSAVSTKLFKF